MPALKGLSRDQLLTQLHHLLELDHTLEADLIAHLGEIDARRLYLEQACPSMFHYCVHVLHFAEGVAYKRIAVARAARRFPELLAALKKGDLHLTAASLLAPHLGREVDRECAEAWLTAARHRTTQEIKQWIADRKPKADVKTSLRKAPAARSTADRSRRAVSNESARAGVAPRPDPAPPGTAREATASTATRRGPDPFAAGRTAQTDVAAKVRASSEPLGANRYCVRFTIDAVVHEELQELRALLRHQIPDGDVAKIVGRAVHSLLEQARKQKRGASPSRRSIRRLASPAARGSASLPSGRAESTTPASAPSGTVSRRIPAAIRRAVWEREGGRCSYLSRGGRRCGTRDFLEFHHQVPWARCREHRESNIHLRCRSHNLHAAELDFGVEHMAACRRRGRKRGAFPASDADGELATASGTQLDSNPVGAEF